MPSMLNLVPAVETTMTRTPMYVEVRVNAVPLMMVFGVSLVLALVYTLWKLLPRIRSGELSSSNTEANFRAGLLNRKLKREKVRSEDDSSADMV
ncbi:uncharacterized protein [Leishmania mexicana MHOM/GT/2001/U1103]|uniref:Uncharacterized protein n=2 Tax=Leishmania mexicana TaxID=5665 RepID=E9B5F4_LEIMU|nr:uncharacterized protein [Leishmania mexicana MHOM/GT/2001/U1103]AAK31148.1 A600-4 protein [Leishmania mexicana]ABJ74174.1 A600-4 [Leishmania mexicana]CBZ30474.1 unnamed protein product [Leishmania mexicana MHOM/GT/2001/U1103]